MDTAGVDAFETLFLRAADDQGKIQTDSQWRRFVNSLISNGCIDTSESATLFSFWDNQRDTAKAFGRDDRPVNLTFSMFERFVLRLADRDPVVSSCLTYMQKVQSETNRVITMGQRWGTEGLDAAHAQQLQELLHDVSKLQHIVVQQVEQSVADQSQLLRTEQEARLLFGPIAEMKAEHAASDGSSAPDGNALWFQKARLALIEKRSSKLRVTPKAYRVQFRHISCNGAHILGHAPFYRCGLAPRRVEVSPAESYFGVETDPGAAHLHKQDEIAQLGSWFATRIDVTRKQALAAVVPFELEIVKLHVTASPDVAEAVFSEIAAHRELTLSPYFPDLCGVSFSDRHYTIAAFEHIQAASLHQLLGECGRLCETQPTYRFWAQEILRALCDLEAQCCLLLAAPLTLRNVFISNQGTRVTIGRVPWGKRVDADGAACAAQLAARSSLLAQSFAGMLDDMLARPAAPSAGKSPAGSGASAGAGAGAGAGADAEDAAGGDAVGIEPATRRSFSRMQCMRGLHVRQGETFVIELPARSGGYQWDPPTVVAQMATEEAAEVEVGVDTLDAIATAGDVFHRTDNLTYAEPVPVCCMPLQATRVGSYSLLLYLRRSWEPIPQQPTTVVQVSVHSTEPSPVLKAIVTACRGADPPSDDGGRASSVLVAPVRLESFKHHPYFHMSATPGLQVVKADFEAAW